MREFIEDLKYAGPVAPPMPHRVHAHPVRPGTGLPFPSLTHVTFTVADLSRSVPWYQRLIGAAPTLDEDIAASRRAVFALGDTVLRLRESPGAGAPSPQRRLGLDRVAFGCADRAQLTGWKARLDEVGIPYRTVVDADCRSGLSFRDPDNIALEFFAPVGRATTGGPL